jgi:hypothetical protein
MYIYMYDDDNRKTLLKSTVSYLRQWRQKKRYQIIVFKRTFSMRNQNEMSWAKPNNSTESYSNAKVIKHTHTQTEKNSKEKNKWEREIDKGSSIAQINSTTLMRINRNLYNKK